MVARERERVGGEMGEMDKALGQQGVGGGGRQVWGSLRGRESMGGGKGEMDKALGQRWWWWWWWWGGGGGVVTRKEKCGRGEG